MKKSPYLYLLILFVALSKLSLAQQKVTWGPVYQKEGTQFAELNFVGADEKFYYLIMRPKKSNKLLQFDFNHNLVKSSELPFEYGGENLPLSEIIHTKMGAFALFAKYEKKDNYFSLHTSEFNQGVFQPLKLAVKTSFATNFKYMYFGNHYLPYDLYDQDVTEGFVLSPDSNYVACLQTLNKDFSKADKINIHIFDAKMKLVYQKTYDFKYKDKKLDIQDFVVNNKGEVYLSAAIEITESQKSSYYPDYAFKLFKFTKENMEEYDLSLGGNNLLSSSTILIDNNDKSIKIGGFYKDKTKLSGGDNGVVFGTFDLETSKFSFKTFPFTNGFLSGLLNEKKIEKGGGLKDFYIKDFITFNDGSYAFISEQMKISINSNVSTSTASSQYKYRFNTHEIVVSIFSKNGELIKNVKLNKDFETYNLLNSSYSLGQYNDKLYLIFNDNKTKEEMNGDKGNKGYIAALKGESIYTDIAIINSKGVLEYRGLLFSGKDITGYFNNGLTRTIGDKILINTTILTKYQYGTYIMK
jgi:hypothetical protein